MGQESRGKFGGSLGFVMSAAGSAVGLGNVWRFPYLAAKDGGGLFLVVYILLAFSFGFAMLANEIAIGRKTKAGVLLAYKEMHPKWGWLGIISFIVPVLFMPYYSVIGGWIVKYMVAYATGQGADTATTGYFRNFTAQPYFPLIFLFIFLACCAVVLLMGVTSGIEKISKIVMPILPFLTLGIAIYSLTLKHTNTDGTVVTGIDGLKIYLIPDLQNTSIHQILRTIVDAMMQLFFSLSVAMGIMITYGSYVPDNVDAVKSIKFIEIFDTVVAFLAGMMIIPAVYVFMGKEGLSSGPSLMFESLPQVFTSMGPTGNFIGAAFFAMIFFAALTSGISVMEAVVSNITDRFRCTRKKAIFGHALFSMGIGVLICMGYNLLYFNVTLPNGTQGQLLDIFDFLSNYLLMPIVAFGTCILIGWILKPQYTITELTKNGEVFHRGWLLKAMTCVVSPLFIVIILLVSFGIIK